MTSKSQEKQSKAAIIDEQLTRMYDFKKRLGKGAYGIVWKALDKRNNQTVAVKKIFDAFRDETDAQRTFREIVFLKAFRNHANVVSLLNVHKASNNLDVYLVFEYMESDLHNIIKKGTILKDVHKRFVMYQLINAVRFIHSGNVIHRDLKPCNILIDNKCRCKLADFGLARSVASQMNNSSSDLSNSSNPEVLLTDYVATRWYRAPEILVASKKYTKGIDMWSLGCIMGEMLRGKPLFQGSSTVNQIEKIVATIPNITEEDIQSIGGGFGTALLNQQAQIEKGPSLDELLKDAPADGLNLVKSLLLLDPLARLTANDAIRHPYVQKFRSSSDEIELKVNILPPINDDVRLSIQDYRDKVYEMSQISPSRSSQVRPSSKQSNNSTSKVKETSKKIESSLQANGPIAKKISPPKKIVSNNAFGHESRALLNVPKVNSQSQLPAKIKGMPIGSNIISSVAAKFDRPKSGSSSGLSQGSTSKSCEKIEKAVRSSSVGPGKGCILRKGSPCMGGGGGQNNSNGMAANNKAFNLFKPGKRSPNILGGPCSHDVPKTGPNVPVKFPSNNNNYNEQPIRKDSPYFHNGANGNNQNLEPNRKVPLPVGSHYNYSNNHSNNNNVPIQDSLNKKPYESNAYMSGSTIAPIAPMAHKAARKFDNLMMNRKMSVPLPGQVPIQTQFSRKPPIQEQNPALYANNNKNSHNIEVQRSVPTITGAVKTSSGQLRNTKSEQYTQSSVAKKQESVCYERRLKRLEEEVERYKSDVNSFCKQSYASTLSNGSAERNKVPAKQPTPTNHQSKVSGLVNPPRKYEVVTHKTKLPSVGSCNQAPAPVHTSQAQSQSHQPAFNESSGFSIKNDHHQYQTQFSHHSNDYSSKTRDLQGHLSSQNGSSKFFAGGGGCSGSVLAAGPTNSNGGSHQSNLVHNDYVNSRFGKYVPVNSQMKTSVKQNHQFVQQYHQGLNSNSSQQGHHFSKYPYQYHHEAAAASMRPVSVSKII